MPFHIHGSQMNDFPPPFLFSCLSLLPSIAPPPPSSHCSGQLPSITVTGRPQHRGRLCGWGARRRRCVYGCDERRRRLLTYQHMAYVYRCVYMCVGTCAFVCLCGVPMGRLVATCHSCWSNNPETTTIWHLKDKYIPLRVKLVFLTSCVENKKSWEI